MVPVGYYIDENQNFQIDPITVPFVVEIFQRYDRGESKTEIRDWLNKNHIKNSKGKVTAILAINYDISRLLMVESALTDLISTGEPQQEEPEKITNINDVLDELIQQSVALVGKPAAVMNKDDKVKAIQFLNQNGAFLVTKSGDKIAKYFGISKYTLYSYIDSKQEGK